ncbi:MAG: AzlC family ABC transporter permease [Spirochaetales bacterium]|nr:AzlC family ABC transporter permease [Spirochaetales bacterium]
MALGYLPVALTFGVLARQTGLTPAEAAGMSAWVYAGASQFLALRMIAAAASPLQIILATFILNFRHLMMGASLARRLAARRGTAAALSYWVTDETFVVASIRLAPGAETKLTARTFLALGLIAYVSWVGGTLAGALLARWIPTAVMGSLSIGLYALFIALLVPSMRKSWRFGLVAAASGAIGFAVSRLAPGISEGWVLIGATLIAAALGTLLPGEPKAKDKPKAGAAPRVESGRQAGSEP